MHLKNIFINSFLILVSVFIGLRFFNFFLFFQDKPKGTFVSYNKKLPNNTLSINHPESFDISSEGQNTIVLIGDSFGVGWKCGNSNNIAGCLSRNSSKHIVNLSKKATTPARYLMSLKTYINDQRKSNKDIFGETVNILLYSNDILIDEDACNYLNSNPYLNFTNSELNKLRSICDTNVTDFHLNQVYVDQSSKFWINFRNNFQFIRYIFGKRVYLVIEEIAGRVVLLTDMPSLGRAGYVKKWGNITAEVKLVASILNDINTFCKAKKCKPIFTIFPNVEDLTAGSKLYKSYSSFQNYMLDNYQIKVFNGYEPFISKNIKRATYSLSDVHANCEGYEVYANWFLDLKSELNLNHLKQNLK